jgi:ubiquinone/menaquinone biosynthesis C-methylase UbiE
MSSTDSDERIAAVYSKLAFIYDAWAWATEWKSLCTALTRAAIQDGEAVLEVAVGTGLVFSEVLRRNPSGRNVGIDRTHAMLRRARRKAELTNVPFMLELGDARSLAFEAESFDVVLCNNMLGLLSEEDISQALREMLRVLRPGGRIVLVTMMCPDNQAAGWLYRLGAIRLGAWRDVQVEPVVKEIGFENVERESVMQLGMPSEVLVGRKARITAAAGAA